MSSIRLIKAVLKNDLLKYRAYATISHNQQLHTTKTAENTNKNVTWNQQFIPTSKEGELSVSIFVSPNEDSQFTPIVTASVPLKMDSFDFELPDS